MSARRVVVCYDISKGRVVKGTRFVDLADQGDPAALVAGPASAGADELVFLDIDGDPGGRAAFLAAVRRAAGAVSVPVTIGGGVRSLEDIEEALAAGAAKVAVNSAIVDDPELLSAAAREFGSERLVASIDARRGADGLTYEVCVAGGRRPTGLEAAAWARECAARGAGEVLLTSIDRDGRRDGFDLELTDSVARAVTVPVTASGGAGSPEHFVELFTRTRTAAGLAAGIFHDGTTTATAVKAALTRAGIRTPEESAA